MLSCVIAKTRASNWKYFFMKRLFLFSLPALAFVWAFCPVTSLKVSGKITDEHGKN